MNKKVWMSILVTGIVFAITAQDSWTVYRTLPSTMWLGHIAYVNGKLFGPGSWRGQDQFDSVFVYSTADYKNWQKSYSPRVGPNLAGMARRDTNIFIADHFGFIARTTDGIQWYGCSIIPEGIAAGIISAGPWLIATTAGTGKIFTSVDDAKRWIAHDVEPIGHLFTGAWSGSVAAVAGSNGLIVTSSDGNTWTRRTSPTTFLTWNGMAWGKDKFVVVGERGLIATSPDGTDWTSRVSGTQLPLMGIVWTGYEFVTIGWDGLVLVSKDGTTWSSRESGTRVPLLAIVSSGKSIIATGDSGVVIVSQINTSTRFSPAPTAAVKNKPVISMSGRTVTVSFCGTDKKGPVTIAVFSVDGRVLLRKNNRMSALMTVDLQGLRSGICIFRVDVDGVVTSTALVLK